MADKKKPKRSKAFPPASEPPTPAKPTKYKRPVRWDLVALFLVITFGGTYLAIFLRPGSGVPRYTYTVLNEYDHDPKAFTQGLLMEDGFLWESTGRNGESSFRKVEFETGKVLKSVELDEKYFGEGLALFEGEFFQVTWKAGKVFVYDRELNLVREHRYAGQGWGLTTDGNVLIMSDGTARLRFLDPKTFDEVGGITVRDEKRRVGQLNELEYVNGNIYANQWNTDLIYEINPENGEVNAIIDLTNLWPTNERPREGVLNGIAFNPKTKKLLVTGKLCPKVYEVELKMIEQ